MKKIKCISISALTVAIAYCSAASLPVFAMVESDSTKIYGYHFENMLTDVIAYRILENDTYANTVYIDPSDLENGDYTFQAGLYLEGDPNELADMWHFHARWQGLDADGEQTKYIKSDNVVTYGYQWNDDKTNMLLKEIEGCKLSVSYNGVDELRSAGPYKALYINPKTGEEKVCDITVDEKSGTGFVVVNEVEYNMNNKFGYTRIPHYDPETPYGELFYWEDRMADIHCMSARVGAWINKVTGDNKMAQFDVIVDQDTPEGVYYMGFETPTENCPNNSMSGPDRQLFPSNLYSLRETSDSELLVNNDRGYWLKIVVGGTEEEKAAAEEAAAYDVDNNGTIDISDASRVLLTYAENAAKSTGDIPILKSTFVSADVNGDGVVDITDAACVLTRYAETGAGL